MLWVDRMPRHWFISLGLGACAVLMAVEAALQRFYLDTTHRGGLIACATIIFLFQATFCAFLDGPTYFYIAEIWPSYARSQGFAMAMITFAVTNVLWLQSAPYAFDSIGWRFYTIFIVVPAVAAIVVFLTYHDTLRRPLEEIAALFGDEDKVAVYQRQLHLGDLGPEGEGVKATDMTQEIEAVENKRADA